MAIRALNFGAVIRNGYFLAAFMTLDGIHSTEHLFSGIFAEKSIIRWIDVVNGREKVTEPSWYNAFAERSLQ